MVQHGVHFHYLGTNALKTVDKGNSRALVNLKESLRESVTQSQSHLLEFGICFLESDRRTWEGLRKLFSTGDFIVAGY